MVLTDKKLSVLAGVAAALLVVTVVVHSSSLFESAGDFTPGSLLIQGLDPKIVAEISISQGKDSVTLQRTKDGFSIKERQGYPVLADKVNGLFINLLGFRCDELVTANKDNHKELGVAADDKGTTVIKLFDKGGKIIAGVAVGGRASRGSGVYIRSIDKDEVYASSNRASFSTSISDYVQTELIKVGKDDVVEVTVAGKDSTFTAARDKDDKIVLQNVPQGKRAKDSDLESLFDVLSNLTLDDIAVDASVAAAPDTTFTCKTNKHATYTVQLSKKDDKHYAKLSVKGPDDALIQKSMMISQDDPQAELDKKAAVLTANDKAKEFNELHNNWVYEIPSWPAGRMRRSLADLIEDIPDGDNPEKITASHILIGYKGSSRSEATRTKAEARKLAEDILAKAKAPGADFAALAKEHSEGPSGKNGGSLGEFDKNTMHENFTKGAWKLKVGDISDIVETPFGFHVIKRTK
ncbi:MAG: peptidylprolyl isomerase [Phycisphaerae bacterium]|jgi:peptidyl-prolyl cis-trans isomerase C/peptidyl-prolyl cis-trans isomerase SurA|nr:peptidylprolyl isomerase [Phycisphaerae bacterium]